jgi:hypothetical protein
MFITHLTNVILSEAKNLGSFQTGNPEMFRFSANEHGGEARRIYAFFALWLKLATARSEFRLQAAFPRANCHVPIADRLKPELRTLFILAPKNHAASVTRPQHDTALFEKWLLM